MGKGPAEVIGTKPVVGPQHRAAAKRLVGITRWALAGCLIGCASHALAPDGPRHADLPPASAAPARSTEGIDIAEAVFQDLNTFRSYRSYARGPVVVLRADETGTQVVCGLQRDALVAEMDRILSNTDAKLLPCTRPNASQLTCTVILNVPSVYVASLNAFLRTDDATLIGVALFNSQLQLANDEASIRDFHSKLESPACP